MAWPAATTREFGRWPKLSWRHEQASRWMRDAFHGRYANWARHLLLGCRGLVFHVDDLHAAIGFRHRVRRILELALAVADGHEVGAGDAVFVDQIFLDRVGAPFGQILIIAFAATRIRLARHHPGLA